MQRLVSVSVSYDVSIFRNSQYSLLLITIIPVSTVWNSLPCDLRSTDISLDPFKNKPNTFLFDADMHYRTCGICKFGLYVGVINYYCYCC